jgi:hypothetical protein
MSWAKVDDQLHAHRKAKLAWKRHPRALGLHLLALSYCAGHLTDGFVDVEFVEEKVPVARERDAVTKALVDAGLWAAEDGGWRIHDWLDYNPSRTDVLEKRRKDSARKSRKDSTRNPRGIHAESAESPNGIHTASRAGAPGRGPAVPDPTYPTPPLPPAGGRERDLIKYEGELAEFSAEHFPGIDAGYVKWAAAELRSRHIEPTVAELRPMVEQYGTVEAT